MNYRIIEKCQLWRPVIWDRSIEAMCDAILEKPADENNDMLDNAVRNILKPLSEAVYDCMIKICELAAQTLIKYAPKALHDKCPQLAFIHHHMDVMAFIIETMVDKNYLFVPDNKEKL